MSMFDKVLSWVYTRKIWGIKCDEFEPECCVCKAWRTHEDLFDE